MSSASHLRDDIGSWSEVERFGLLVKRFVGKRATPMDERALLRWADTVIEMAQRERQKDRKALGVVQSNPRPDVLMSHDVLAVMYVHAKDKKVYVHVFGVDVEEQVREGTVTLRLMTPAPRSQILMYAVGRGQLVLQHQEGKDITQEF